MSKHGLYKFAKYFALIHTQAPSDLIQTLSDTIQTPQDTGVFMQYRALEKEQYLSIMT